MGVASIIFSMVLYFIDPKMMFGGVGYLGILITIYFTYKAAADERVDNEGFLSFGEAFKASFLAIAIGFLFATLFQYVLINFIDPSLVDVLRDTALESAESMAGMFGADESAMEGIKEAMEEQDFSPSLLGTLGNYIGMLVVGAIISLIVAAITKRTNNT